MMDIWSSQGWRLIFSSVVQNFTFKIEGNTKIFQNLVQMYEKKKGECGMITWNACLTFYGSALLHSKEIFSKLQKMFCILFGNLFCQVLWKRTLMKFLKTSNI